MTENSFYEPKKIGWHLAVLVGLTALCKVTAGNGFVVLVPALLYAIAKRDAVLLMNVLFWAVCGMVTNGYFMPKSIAFQVTDKIVLLGSAVALASRIFGNRHPRLLTPLLSLVPYLLYIAITSQWGWQPLISSLKIILFTLAFFAMYGGALSSMRHSGRDMDLRNMFLAMAIFFIVGSIVVSRIGGVGYLGSDEFVKNPELTSLFKGMTNHSQMLGPVVAVFGILLFADWLFALQRFDKLYCLLLLLCPYLVWQTGSRTALASFIAGILMVLFCVMRSRRMRSRWRAAVGQVAVLAVILGVGSTLFVPQVQERVERFIVKYDQSSMRTDLSSRSILRSRAAKIDELKANWAHSPLLGNGFQVSADMQNRRALGIKDLLTAPVEKGIWTYGVLEEGGILGMALFAFFLLTSLMLLLQRRAYCGLSLFVTVIMINLGEFTIFSMSALGGVLWFLVFLALVFDYKRMRRNAETGNL